MNSSNIFNTPTFWRKEFKNERVVTAHSIKRQYYSDLDIEKIRQEWCFTVGSCSKVNHHSSQENLELFLKPVTAMDWLKCLVVEFEPTLNFGWLAPKMEHFACSRNVHHQETYYNVLPTPQEFSDRSVMIFQELAPHIDFDSISEINLLNSEPPMQGDVAQQKMKAREIAAYMAAYTEGE